MAKPTVRLFSDFLVQDLRSRSPKILDKQADILLEAAREEASLDDHTLQELRRMGYPYSRREGVEPPHEGAKVHKQSGRLHDAIEKSRVRKSGDRFRVSVGVSELKVPYISHVVYGTRNMVGRDFLKSALQRVQPRLKAVTKKGMRR